MTTSNDYETEEMIHGKKVPDPYRYLEDPNRKETREWLKDQEYQSAEYFSKIQKREDYKFQLRNHFQYTKYYVPERVQSSLYFLKTSENENQPKLYVKKDRDPETKVLIDPNRFSEDQTVALSNYFISKDGRYVAYGRSKQGSDWQEFRIIDSDTLQEFSDRISWVKFTTIAWDGDSKGFYYTRFPDPSTQAPEDEGNHPKVYYHLLGTSQEEDPLIYENPKDKELGFQPLITDDYRFLCLTLRRGTSPKNGFYVMDLEDPAKGFRRVFEEGEAEVRYLSNNGTDFFFLTDLDAGKKRVIQVSINGTNGGIQEIIPEGTGVIQDARMVHQHFVLTLLTDCCHEMVTYNIQGEYKGTIDIPKLSSVIGLSGKRNHREMYIGTTDFLSPTVIYKYSFEVEDLSEICRSKVLFDPEEYETRQVFIPSKDGTEIPLFITGRKDLSLDEPHKTLLYGYGGFNISLTPQYNPGILPWLQEGGLYVVANLRGGGEYGDDWHQSGMLSNKQRVYEDFIAAGEWLVNQGYTAPEKLGIYGRSNGGLLVAASMIQRPDLFGAVISSVPVIDMLRYHKFTIGRYWVPEYGTADNPEHFKFLYQYSPLHNVEENREYPPILISSAEGDNRVVPAHAMKFAATLQQAKEKNPEASHPVIFRLEKKAGHGHGKPTYKIIEEWADFLSFLHRELEEKNAED
ncbi:prolyl oligopeptidase family serine peptidase [Isachenkonia alkalipeptolytica]|uniref:prolyl oligopeptidase n=1 Tax=Isachenkonia alkalipeptolytica TaxID=2565777 RepID=A0AA43XIC1_9CLOT|nr:prolyl oligopeptidase family serine peptidase [Isachenkonia alkalipeptolytica]NBG86986.1 S9 family peptidase [Isachenkonia alkalipeptolytica]